MQILSQNVNKRLQTKTIDNITNYYGNERGLNGICNKKATHVEPPAKLFSDKDHEPISLMNSLRSVGSVSNRPL